MKKMNGKKIAALMTALVLALGVSIPAGTALADEKTDSLRDAIYRTLKEKQQAQEAAPAEFVAPPVSTDSGAAQTEEQTEAQPEEAAAEEAAPEATSPYLRMKVTGAATLMDITADAANAFTDAEVLAAFRIENAEASATVTVALAQKPAMAEGDKLQLVGLNDWIINKRMVVGGLEIGQKVQFTARMVDGFALILRHSALAVEEAVEAPQPEAEVKPEELAQPEAEPEITADAVTTPSKAEVAKQILKDLTTQTEEPAAAEAEQPEAAEEDTEVQSDEKALADEAAEEAAEASEEQTEAVEENTEVQNSEEENDEEISEELNEELPEQPEAVVREEEEPSEEPAEEEAEDEELSEESDEEEAGEDASEVELEDNITEEPAEETESPVEETAEEIPSNPEDLRKLAHKFSDLVILDDYDTPLGIEDFKKITMLDVTDVRIDPDGMSPIFLTLEKDEEVTLIGMEGDWAQIVVGEEIGYIYKDALEAEPVEEEAVTEAAAEETTEEAVEPEKKVTIFTSRRVVMEEGETVNLTSKIEGFEGYEVMYQWECDQGNGFQPVEAANAATYAFTASAESLSWSWQLMVYYR